MLKRALFIIILFWLGTGLLAACDLPDLPFIERETPTPLPTATPLPTPTPIVEVVDNGGVALIDALGRDIAERRTIDVYERVSPSVVNITTQVLRRGFFFNTVPQEGAGSGFVLDEEGHILTNYHVIEGAESIEVGLSDDQIFPATVVGVDPRNDVAVVQIEAPAELLVPVEFADSTGLEVGQRAIAIGNPFGQFGRTLTTGVIDRAGSHAGRARRAHDQRHHPDRRRHQPRQFRRPLVG